MNYKHSQKGISLLLAIFILTFTLGIALGTATILIRQIEIMREIGYSSVAFFAADSGIERVLYEDRSSGLSDGETRSDCFLENNACYDVKFNKNGGTIIKSKGTYKSTNRTIEIQY